MLKISNLKLGYDDKTIIEMPEYIINDKENLLISGNSGSGKTTLLYALAGLLKPQAGNIELNGSDLTKLNGSALDNFRGQNIGIVFQTLHIIAAVSVLNNILVAQYMGRKPADKSRAQSLLKSLGIENLADRKPSEISHGQAQRVAIARAAINQPKLILADEPTSALDDDSAANVIKLLLDVASQSGATLIVASHDARIKSSFIKTLDLGAK